MSAATMGATTKALMAANAPQRLELKEQFSVDVRALHEGRDGAITELPDGRFRVRCKMQHCGVKNRNNRVYPAETTWGKHTLPESAFVRRIKARRVTGQLEHPDNGRCLGAGTPVLMADGRLVPVEQIMVGDRLMGPDGRARTVLEVTQGHGPLYRIDPCKSDSWVCNGPHVLTVQHVSTDEVIDIPLQEWLARGEFFRSRYKQFSVGVEAFENDLPPPVVDPYFLGVWFGDGTKQLKQMADGSTVLVKVNVTKPDPEIRAVCQEMASRWELRCHEWPNTGGCPTYSIVGERGQENRLLRAMRDLVGPQVTVPDCVLRGNRDTRLAFLAGFLDTDAEFHAGTTFYITQERQDWAFAIWWVARSLGLGATIKPVHKVWTGRKGQQCVGDYHFVTIFGDVSAIPTRIARKQAPERQLTKCPTRTGFTVSKLEDGEFFGFELDGDGRFLLGDFTVTHNSSMDLGSIVITDIEPPNKGGEVFGTFETMSTPGGKIVTSYIRDNVGFGMSSRGEGTVIRDAQGVDEVQPDFMPTTIDCVLDESTPGAEVAAQKLKESAKALLESAGGDHSKAELLAQAQTDAAVFRDVLLGEQMRGSKQLPAPTSPPTGFNQYVASPADGAGHYRAYQTGIGQWDVWFHPHNLAPLQIASGLQTYKDAKFAAENHLRWNGPNGAEPDQAGGITRPLMNTGGQMAPAAAPAAAPAPAPTAAAPQIVLQIQAAPAPAQEAYAVAGTVPFAGTTVFLFPFDSEQDAAKGQKALEKAGFYVDLDGDAMSVQTSYPDAFQAVAHIKRVLCDAGLNMTDERFGYRVTREGVAVLEDNVPEKYRSIEAINNLLGTVYDPPATTVPQEDGDVRYHAVYGDDDDGEGEDDTHLTIINIFQEPSAIDLGSGEDEESEMKEPMPVTIQAPMPEMDLPVPGREEMGAGSSADTPPPGLRAKTKHDDDAESSEEPRGNAVPGDDADDGQDHSADDTEIRADDPEDDGDPEGKGKMSYDEIVAAQVKAKKEYFEMKAKAERMRATRKEQTLRHFAGGAGATCCGQQHEHVAACLKPQLSEEGSGYGTPPQIDDPEDLNLDLDRSLPPDEGPTPIDLTYTEAAGSPGGRRARKVKLSPVALSIFEVLRASSRPLSKSDITGLLVIPDNMWIRALHELHGAGLVGTVGIGPGTRYRAIYDAPSESSVEVEGLIADSIVDKLIDPALAKTLPEYFANAPRPLKGGKRPEGQLRLYFNESDQLIEVQEFDAAGVLVSRAGMFAEYQSAKFAARFEALIAEMKKKAKKAKKDKDDEDEKKTDEAKKKDDKKDKDDEKKKADKKKTDEAAHVLHTSKLVDGCSVCEAKKKADKDKDDKDKDKKKTDEAKKKKDDEDEKKKADEKKAKRRHEATRVLAAVTDAVAKGGMETVRDFVRENWTSGVLQAGGGGTSEDDLTIKKHRYLQDEVARLEQENVHLNELVAAMSEQQRGAQIEARLVELVKSHPKLTKLTTRLSRCETVEELNQEAQDLLAAISEASKPATAPVTTPAKNGVAEAVKSAAPAPTPTQNGTQNGATTTKTSVTSLEVQDPPKGPLSESEDQRPNILNNSKSPASGDHTTGRTAAYRSRKRQG
jgi:hypothetical protein